MAAPKGGKKVIRRRRERKHIERGAAHIRAGIQRKQKVYSLCRSVSR